MGYETDHGQRRGQGATPAAFYLGLCRLRGILSPPASATVILQAGNSYLSQRWCCRRAVLLCRKENYNRTQTSLLQCQRFFAAIPDSGPEIKNRCTQEGLNGEKLASIPKFGPEIKNRCTQEGLNGENLASILKFGPEIKNRCTQEGLNGEKLHRFASLSLKSRIDARWRAFPGKNLQRFPN